MKSLINSGTYQLVSEHSIQGNAQRDTHNMESKAEGDLEHRMDAIEHHVDNLEHLVKCVEAKLEEMKQQFKLLEPAVNRLVKAESDEVGEKKNEKDFSDLKRKNSLVNTQTRTPLKLEIEEEQGGIEKEAIRVSDGSNRIKKISVIAPERGAHHLQVTPDEIDQNLVTNEADRRRHYTIVKLRPDYKIGEYLSDKIGKCVAGDLHVSPPYLNVATSLITSGEGQQSKKEISRFWCVNDDGQRFRSPEDLLSPQSLTRLTHCSSAESFQ